MSLCVQRTRIKMCTEAVALILTAGCVRAAFPFKNNSNLIATFRSSGKKRIFRRTIRRGIPNGSFIPLSLILETG